MKQLIDAFWRAAAYCLHPRVILLSLTPVVVVGGLAFVLGWFFWEPATDAINAWSVTQLMRGWLGAFGLDGVRSALAPLMLLLLTTPLLVLVSLLVVAMLMTPAMLRLVARRRFPNLERRQGGSLFGSVFVGLWATLAALLATLVSMPLWLVPPLVLVLPPLIWGWLTYRVMSYDVLAEHASRAERLALVRAHRLPLLAIGVITGYLGAAPSLVWVFSGVAVIVLAPVLVPVAVWIYTLVFAFSSLWFSHYALAALQDMRAAETAAAPPTLGTVERVDPPEAGSTRAGPSAPPPLPPPV